MTPDEEREYYNNGLLFVEGFRDELLKHYSFLSCDPDILLAFYRIRMALKDLRQGHEHVPTDIERCKVCEEDDYPIGHQCRGFTRRQHLVHVMGGAENV